MIREALDKTVNINLFDSIRRSGESFHFTEFREKYDYISLVYLEDGCNPCYPRFVDWHGKINSFLDYKNYTVLFVIRTNSYERFLEYASEYGDVEDHLYLVVDRHNRFLDNNRDIPRPILDRSVLIDKENKIKLIGPPYATPEMAKLFDRVVEGTDLLAGETSGSPIIEFDRETYDFGEIPVESISGPREIEFILYNRGSKPLVLTNVESCCGTRVESYTRAPISPGDSGYVRASSRLQARPQVINHTVTVHSNDKNRGRVDLRIWGTVN